jgi:hypothetical protein
LVDSFVGIRYNGCNINKHIIMLNNKPNSLDLAQRLRRWLRLDVDAWAFGMAKK